MKEEYSDSIDTSIDIDVVDVNMSKIYPADIPNGIPENASTDALDGKESTVAQDVTIQEDTETSENEDINEQNIEKDFICEDTEDEENEDINEQDTKKDFICEDTEDEENEAINEQDNEEDFTCEDSEDGENDKIACADVIKDLVDQNVTKSHLPQNGEWSDPSAKGNSDFIMSDDAIIKWGRGEKDKCTGAELKQWMRENYDTESVRYNHKEPDFSLFIDNKIGQIHLDRMPTKRNGGSYSQAEKIAMSKLGQNSQTEVQEYMKQNDLTWHECADGHTVIAIPTRINAAFKHTGGISIERSLESMREMISMQTDGASLNLQREAIGGMTEGLSQAIDAQHKNFRETKSNMFRK